MDDVRSLSDQDLLDYYDDLARQRPVDQASTDLREGELESCYLELRHRDLSWQVW